MDIFLVKKKMTSKKDGKEVHFFVPNLDDSLKKSLKFKENQVYKFSSSLKRSHKKNAYLWSVINFMFENLPEALSHNFEAPDILEKYLCCEIGHCELFKIGNDNFYKIPKSISFLNESDEVDFTNKVFNPMLEKIAELMGYKDKHDLALGFTEWKMQNYGVKK